MRNINYREDFVLLIQLLNHKGEPVGVPDVDFSIRFYSGHSTYTVGRKEGKSIRCAPMDDGRLRIVFDGHGLSPVKELVGHATWQIPDFLMPDGIRDLPQIIPTGVTLTLGPSDRPSDAEVSVMLPFIKGEPGDAGDDANVVALGYMELETDTKIYRVPVTAELCGSSDRPSYGYGYEGWELGVWDIDLQSEEAQ